MHTRRPRDGSQRIIDRLHDFFFQRCATGFIRSAACVFQHGESNRHLAFEFVFHADDSNFGDVWVALYGLFDLARAEAMTGNIDHIIGAAEDEVIAVLIANAPIERRVRKLAFKIGEIGFYEAFVVAPDRSHAARRQRRNDGDDGFLVGANFFAGNLVQQFHVVAIYRKTRATEFAWRVLDAQHSGQHGPAGFRLPVMIDDRLFDAIGDPARSRFIQWLTGEK